MISLILRGFGILVMVPGFFEGWLVLSLGFPLWAKWAFFGTGLAFYLAGAVASIIERKRKNATESDSDTELN